MTDRKEVKSEDNCGCAVRGTCRGNPCTCKNCSCETGFLWERPRPSIRGRLVRRNFR